MIRERPENRVDPAFEDESGMALVSIIGLTAVLTLLAVIAVGFALNSQTFSRNHQDWNAALAAAEAGIDDYLARLNRDRQYYETADSDIDPGTGLNQNPALDRWAELPDSDAYYHYSVDASEVLQTGTVTLTSTGLVGDQTRTVQVRIRPESFFDFIYFTDYEVVDPAIVGGTNCDRRWGASPARSTNCFNLRFISADELFGPVHSNDAIQIEGSPTFHGPVTTSFNESVGGYYQFQGSHNTFTPSRVVEPTANNHRFARDFDPAWDETKTFPPTNTGMLGDAQNHGCVYHGPTYIHLQGDAMTVRSPLSGNGPSDSPATTTECAGGAVSNLEGFQGGIEIPPIIYVNEAGTCGSFSSSNHPLGLDRNEETRSGLRYNCRYGDVFVWGELDTQLTIAAHNDINVIWDLTYQDGEWQDGTNILGLVADNFVQVRQPRNNADNGNRPVARHAPFPSNQPAGASHGDLFRDPTIHGAILSLERSFRVQNHDRISPLGDLIVRGSIAQKYRGPVGTGSATTPSTGFVKDYRYDERLRYVSPPFFLDPVESRFVVRAWAEIQDSTAHPEGLPPRPDGD